MMLMSSVRHAPSYMFTQSQLPFHVQVGQSWFYLKEKYKYNHLSVEC